MVIKIDWVSKIVGLIGALNVALIAFGTYHFSNVELDAINKLFSAFVTVIGVWLPHLKEVDATGDDDEYGQDNVH